MSATLPLASELQVALATGSAPHLRFGGALSGYKVLGEYRMVGEFVVRMRETMLAIVILVVLCLGVTQASAGDAPPPVVCVSAVGPVDANGHGDTTSFESGDCP